MPLRIPDRDSAQAEDPVLLEPTALVKEEQMHAHSLRKPSGVGDMVVTCLFETTWTKRRALFGFATRCQSRAHTQSSTVRPPVPRRRLTRSCRWRRSVSI